MSPRATGKASRTSVRLADLVEDLSVYPRDSVDSANVRRLVEALQAGVRLPPIIACAESLRIVDGFHRRRAYLRLADEGPEAKVRVELRHYADEVALLTDAVQLNLHGKPLNEIERSRLVFRLGKLGVDDDRIAAVLRVPERKVTTIKLRVANVVTPKGEPLRLEPLKPSVRHLMGREMSEQQARAHRSAPGVTYTLLIRQLRQAMQYDLLNSEDGRTMTALRTLIDEGLAYLAEHP